MIAIDFHVHSQYSPDSILTPQQIIKTAKKRGLSGVAVTDHNTIRGGVETLKLARNENDFLVIVGAEITTNIGDLTGIFLEREIESRDFFEVANEIKEQGGMVILPHPGKTFYKLASLDSLDEEMLSKIDIIEGFNARVKNKRLNRKAQELAQQTGKTMTGGGDAHFPHEIGHGVTLFDDSVPLQPEAIRAALLQGKTEVKGKVLPFPLYVIYEFGVGQALKHIKSRRG